MKTRIMIVLLSGLISCAALAAQPKPAPRAAAKIDRADKTQRAVNKTQAQAANQEVRAARQALSATNLPGGLALLDRLSKMSPEEQDAALANLAPIRRENIKKRVEAYSNMSPEQKERIQGQFERLNALPPDKRLDAGQALSEFQNVPAPRKGVLFMELGRLSRMTDDQRSVYMARPAFRSRFSESEIQMMNNLRGIVP